MKYIADPLLFDSEGFIPRITPTQDQEKELKKIRAIVREALRTAFKAVSKSFTEDKSGGGLSFTLIEEVAYLEDELKGLNQEQRRSVRNLSPKFYSQGSFVYKTLNRPCHQPPQQMDLDDGIYLPLEILRERPIVGKKLFFKIVDSTLQLLAEKNGWTFVAKDTCSRLNIDVNLHVDVPLYAIPLERYVQLNKSAMMESVSSQTMDSRQYLEKDEIYLAVRSKESWIQSDPMEIHQWFTKNCSPAVHGERLRRTCRYLKAWRDFHFKSGGPASIALMACAVDTFATKGSFSNDSQALLECSRALRTQLALGVKNPVDDELSMLFDPEQFKNNGDLEQILSQCDALHSNVSYALHHAESKSICISSFVEIFGERCPNRPDLIQSFVKASIVAQPAIPQPQPEVKNTRAG